MAPNISTKKINPVPESEKTVDGLVAKRTIKLDGRWFESEQPLGKLSKKYADFLVAQGLAGDPVAVAVAKPSALQTANVAAAAKEAAEKDQRQRNGGLTDAEVAANLEAEKKSADSESSEENSAAPGTQGTAGLDPLTAFTAIPGIAKPVAQTLISAGIDTLEKLNAATVDQLVALKIGDAIIKQIRKYFDTAK